MIISINKLLDMHDMYKEIDFSNSKHKIKFVRHIDNRKPEDRLINGNVYRDSLYHLYRTRRQLFELYQSEQKIKNFKGVDYIISFIGENGNKARFIGVYKNNGIKAKINNEKCFFDFEKIDIFKDLEQRVIIDWGEPAISWHQWIDNNEKQVIMIDQGFGKIPPFSRYEDVMLDYNTLHNIFDQNNSEWRSKLGACNGIYLILDKSNGKQYIGSTYNKNGIWGRWEDYAKDGHGGDKDLQALIQNDPNYGQNNFQWCILETLPINITENAAIERESLYKEKFGTRGERGYNNN